MFYCKIRLVLTCGSHTDPVTYPVVEEVADVRGADQSIESLAAGGLDSPPEAVVILVFTMSQN